MHSFNLGDVSQVSPDTFLEFKAYKLVRAAGSSLEQDFMGEFRLSIAQMRLKSYGEKVRKSLGLTKAANMRQAGRFNIALTVLEQQEEIAAESRSMIEKLRENDVSKSMIVNNQSFGDASAGNNMVSNDAYDWTLQIDLRSATNLSSK